MSNCLDWIGTLPDGWRVKPLRAIADSIISNVDKFVSDDEIPIRLCNYIDVYNNDFIKPDLDLMRATASAQEIERFGLLVDDVIITKDSESWEDIGVPALVTETADDIVCGYHLALLRPHKDTIHGAFLFRCLQARPVQAQLELTANGVTRFGLSKSDIRRTTVPVPPLREQRAIADYLDRETARLDALVAAKERLLALLAEKRRAIVTRAVTRGLDPRVPTRDSGVPWLGAIPAHWEIRKLGHVASIGNGSTPNRDTASYWTDDGGIPWLNSSVVNQPEVTAADQFVTALAVQKCHLPLVRAGSVLIAITGQGKTRGRAVVLAIDSTINQHLAFIQPERSRLRPWFLRWTLFAAYDFLRSISDDAGGTKGALTCDGVANLRVPVPPADEQSAILDHVTISVGRFDSLRSVAEKTIAIIRERRSAIISAAVAGKIDVERTACG